MATTVIYSDATDGKIYGQNATYATARTTPQALEAVSATGGTVGQTLSGGLYSCFETFLAFDTSGIAGTVDTAVLALTDFTDFSTTDFTLEARVDDWGATLDLSDYVSGASLSGFTLVATYTSVSGWTGAVYHDLTDVALPANVNQLGFTRVVLSSDRHRLGTTPTGDEYVTSYMSEQTGTTKDPKLTVVSTVTPVAALTGTMTAGATEADLVAGGKVLTVTLSDATFIPA